MKMGRTLISIGRFLRWGVSAAVIMILALVLLFPMRSWALSDKEKEEIEKKAKEAGAAAAKEYLDEAIPELTGEVTIKGVGEFGYHLEVQTDIKTKDPGKLEYTWYRYDEDKDKTVQIGTGKRYTVQDKDVGYVIRVEVTAKGARGKLTDSLDEENNGGKHIHRAEIDMPSAAFEMDYEPVVADDGTVTYTVVIPKAQGCEYSFDGENWSAYNVAAGCQPGSTVIGFRRYQDTDYVKAVTEPTTSTLTLPDIPKETAMMANPGAATPEQQAAAGAAAKADQQAKADAAKEASEKEATAIVAANKAEKEKARAAEEAKRAEEEAAEAAKAAERAEKRAAEEAARAEAVAAEEQSQEIAAAVGPGGGAVLMEDELPVDQEEMEKAERLKKENRANWIRVLVLGGICLLLVGVGFEILIAGRGLTAFRKRDLTGSETRGSHRR